jgi:hypothetical protein
MPFIISAYNRIIANPQIIIMPFVWIEHYTHRLSKEDRPILNYSAHLNHLISKATTIDKYIKDFPLISKLSKMKKMTTQSFQRKSSCP